MKEFKSIITHPEGQNLFPGQITTIEGYPHGTSITMQNTKPQIALTPYGASYMMPNMDYKFAGNTVVELPIAQMGGQDQQQQLMEMIQVYAQMKGMKPEELIQKLQSLPKEQQQQAVQSIAQEVQQAMAQQQEAQMAEQQQEGMMGQQQEMGMAKMGGEPCIECFDKYNPSPQAQDLEWYYKKAKGGLTRYQNNGEVDEPRYNRFDDALHNLPVWNKAEQNILNKYAGLYSNRESDEYGYDNLLEKIRPDISNPRHVLMEKIKTPWQQTPNPYVDREFDNNATSSEGYFYNQSDMTPEEIRDRAFDDNLKLKGLTRGTGLMPYKYEAPDELNQGLATGGEAFPQAAVYPHMYAKGGPFSAANTYPEDWASYHGNQYAMGGNTVLQSDPNAQTYLPNDRPHETRPNFMFETGGQSNIEDIYRIMKEGGIDYNPSKKKGGKFNHLDEFKKYLEKGGGLKKYQVDNSQTGDEPRRYIEGIGWVSPAFEGEYCIDEKCSNLQGYFGTDKTEEEWKDYLANYEKEITPNYTYDYTKNNPPIYVTNPKTGEKTDIEVSRFMEDGAFNAEMIARNDLIENRLSKELAEAQKSGNTSEINRIQNELMDIQHQGHTITGDILGIYPDWRARKNETYDYYTNPQNQPSTYLNGVRTPYKVATASSSNPNVAPASTSNTIQPVSRGPVTTSPSATGTALNLKQDPYYYNPNMGTEHTDFFTKDKFRARPEYNLYGKGTMEDTEMDNYSIKEPRISQNKGMSDPYTAYLTQQRQNNQAPAQTATSTAINNDLQFMTPKPAQPIVSTDNEIDLPKRSTSVPFDNQIPLSLQDKDYMMANSGQYFNTPGNVPYNQTISPGQNFTFTDYGASRSYGFRDPNTDRYTYEDTTDEENPNGIYKVTDNKTGKVSYPKMGSKANIAIANIDPGLSLSSSDDPTYDYSKIAGNPLPTPAAAPGSSTSTSTTDYSKYVPVPSNYRDQTPSGDNEFDWNKYGRGWYSKKAQRDFDAGMGKGWGTEYQKPMSAADQLKGQEKQMKKYLRKSMRRGLDLNPLVDSLNMGAAMTGNKGLFGALAAVGNLGRTVSDVSSGWLNPGRLFKEGGELDKYQAWMSQPGSSFQHSDTPLTTFVLPESMRYNAAYNSYLNSHPMATEESFLQSNTTTNPQGYEYSFMPGSTSDPAYAKFSDNGAFNEPIYNQNVPTKKKKDKGWKFNFQRAEKNVAGLGQIADYFHNYKVRNSDDADTERRNMFTSEFMPVFSGKFGGEKYFGGGQYGDWSTNATQGTSFRPDEMVYAQKMGRPYRDVNVYDYAEYSLKKGGSILDKYNEDEEYDLTEEEIRQIVAAGGTIEYL